MENKTKFSTSRETYKIPDKSGKLLRVVKGSDTKESCKLCTLSPNCNARKLFRYNGMSHASCGEGIGADYFQEVNRLTSRKVK